MLIPPALLEDLARAFFAMPTAFAGQPLHTAVSVGPTPPHVFFARPERTLFGFLDEGNVPTSCNGADLREGVFPSTPVRVLDPVGIVGTHECWNLSHLPTAIADGLGAYLAAAASEPVSDPLVATVENRSHQP